MNKVLLTIVLCLPNAGCDLSPDAITPKALETPTLLSLDRIDVSGSKARYTGNRAGKITMIDFAVPADKIAPEIAHVGGPIGETTQGVVVMQDDYASRPVGGKCRDGMESFVRVFSLPERRQVMAIAVESCRDGLVAPKPQATWLDGDQFRIETPPKRTFAIMGTDRVEAIKEEAVAYPLAATRETSIDQALSADVVAFKARRDNCDHLRGEDPSDNTRAVELEAALTSACSGTDTDLASLRRRHGADARSMRALAPYDDNVE